MSADTTPRLRIFLPVDTCLATIELDGKRMDNVSRIELDVNANSVTQVRLTLYACVEIEGALKNTEIIHVERPTGEPSQDNEATDDVLGPALESEWEQSRHNKTAVMESQLAGCFHCLGLVVPTAITEWVDENGTTAICPDCGIDSLIPHMEMKNPMLLLQLRKRYFDE